MEGPRRPGSASSSGSCAHEGDWNEVVRQAPYAEAQQLFSWAKANKSYWRGKLFRAGHSPEAIRRLTVDDVLDVAYSLLRDHAEASDLAIGPFTTEAPQNAERLEAILAGGYTEDDEDDLDEFEDDEGNDEATIISLARWAEFGNRVIE